MDPATEAGEALREVARRLLENLEASRPGAMAGGDPDALHDLRVAVRRTRTLLRLARGVWEREAVRRFRRDFARMGKATGPVRDLDVFLLALPDYRAELAEPARAGFEPLRRLLDGWRMTARERLASELGGARYRRLIEAWRSFLDDRSKATDRPDAAREPVGPLAARVIQEAHRRVLRRGGAIAADSPPKALHRLRIDAKKLRYAIEFFRELYPPDDVESLIGALKRLQDNLGDFNDYGVQLRLVERFERELDADPADGAGAAAAPRGLAALLERARAEERARFSELFSEFAAEGTSARFRALR